MISSGLICVANVTSRGLEMASHAGEQIMKRVSLGVAVLCALSIAAFEGPGDLAFDLSPAQREPTDPKGQWDRADGTDLSLLIFRDPRGAWIIESTGEPGTGQPANACRRVYAGSLNGTELVTSSDAGRDLTEILTRGNLAPYQGLFVDFKGERAKVTGPESDAPDCPLAGVYVRHGDKR
jgi:hypothetical protein